MHRLRRSGATPAVRIVWLVYGLWPAIAPGATSDCGTHDGDSCDSTFSIDGQGFDNCTDSLLVVEVEESHVQVWVKRRLNPCVACVLTGTHSGGLWPHEFDRLCFAAQPVPADDPTLFVACLESAVQSSGTPSYSRGASALGRGCRSRGHASVRRLSRWSSTWSLLEPPILSSPHQECRSNLHSG